MLKTVALIAAAGQGKRMGSKLNKQYLPLLGKPVLAHTLEVFQQHPLIDDIIVIATKDEVEFCKKEVVEAFDFNKVSQIVAGGQERQDSIYRGLQSLPEECDLVVVHDGARPLVTPQILTEAIKEAQLSKASVVAVPVKDTIKQVNREGFVEKTLNRAELVSVQTPQVFKKEIILKAYEEAFKKGIYGTDDASLVELWGIKVKVVMGSYENIKITTPEDIELALSLIRGRNS
ncbi:MAG: 2-C-methyl-D-erythritol 4-phosphate cytidylyltransferase [Clostridia bacterium]|nr:2-C-methyl-D-erythritol 4-phosphate cytidylyltransferase [Clostridia bacterium]